MKPTKTEDRQIQQTPSKILFHVIGPNKIQNDLMMSFLEGKFESVADQSRDIDIGYKMALKAELSHFFLIDCLDSDTIDPWAYYKMDRLQTLKKHHVLFYNDSVE